MHRLQGLAGFVLFGWLALAPVARAQTPEPRVALVIGNSAYGAGALATPANDAGLIAQTLTEAGFEVAGARDVDQDSLRHAFSDFLDKAAMAGPDAVAFVYLGGYGLQYAGENYFAPIEARIPRDTSVPLEALRISDFTRALAELPLKARIVVLDAARDNPFAPSGPRLAGGLALQEPGPGSLIAFNAAPGTIGRHETGDYGVYAKALAEMIREGGARPEDIFARTRLRVSEATRGAQVPWDEARLPEPFLFFPASAEQPVVAMPDLRGRALRDLPVEEAYAAALTRDTISAYQDFLTAYPNDPLSPRVRAMLAARREALTWRRSVSSDTASAYWTYLHRYPNGPHAADARRRLANIGAGYDVPVGFMDDVFDVAPPPRVEYEIVDSPVVLFDDYYAPPRAPVWFLPAQSPAYMDLQAPRHVGSGFLPIPIPIPMSGQRSWRQGSAPRVYNAPVPLPGGVTPRDPGRPSTFMPSSGGRLQQQPAQMRPLMPSGQFVPPVSAQRPIVPQVPLNQPRSNGYGASQQRPLPVPEARTPQRPVNAYGAYGAQQRSTSPQRSAAPQRIDPRLERRMQATGREHHYQPPARQQQPAYRAPQVQYQQQRPQPAYQAPQVRQQAPVQQMRQAPPQQMRQAPPQQMRQAPPQQMRQAPPQQMRQAPPPQVQQQRPQPQAQPQQRAPQRRDCGGPGQRPC